MPPAAATHQIVGEIDRLNQVPHVTSSKYIFDGIPSEDGQLKLKELETFLNSISRGGATLLANVNGTDPGAGADYAQSLLLRRWRGWHDDLDREV